MNTTPACVGNCTTHDRLCELDGGHAGDHECLDCPNHKARQRKQAIADRIAAHRVYADVVATTHYDED